jgi:ADP-heptose:LPS heptosyltransferase
VGYGDDLGVTAQAEELYRNTGTKFAPEYDSVIFKENPVMHYHSPYKVPNNPGRRPYILAVTADPHRIIFNPLSRASRGVLPPLQELGLPKQEYIFIEPHIKGQYSARNKDWGFENYQRLVNETDVGDMIWMQPDYGLPKLEGVSHVGTRDFLHGCGYLAGAVAYVGPEGGLHHAAAALDIPGIVIFGGYISPQVSGYESHDNLFVYDEAYPLGCGAQYDCDHCRESMSQILVEDVRELVEEVAGL